MDPVAVAVQVLGAVDVAADIAAIDGLAAAQVAVAGFIELVPGVAADGADQGELGAAVGVGADQHGPAGAEPLGPAGGEDFGFTGADGDFGRAVGEHGDAVVAVGDGPDGRAGGRKLDLGIAAGQRREGDGAAGDLQKILPLFKLGEADLAVRRDADAVVIVELNFGAGGGPGGDPVLGEQRSVDGPGNPVARVAALHGDVAIHQAQTRHAAPGSFFLLWRLLLSPQGGGDADSGQQQAWKREKCVEAALHDGLAPFALPLCNPGAIPERADSAIVISALGAPRDG